jgi:hypothetical protein
MEARIRPLTRDEIESLQKALGKPVDRKYLAHWISRSIADAIKLADRPTPRQMRDVLLRIERGGRAWLREVGDGKATLYLTAHADLRHFVATTTAFCDDVARLARDLDPLVRGRPQTPAALEGFVLRMLGIAKRAGVLPSTPSRRLNRRSPNNPPFFRFVTTALRVAKQVIKTSSISADQRAVTLSKLRVQSPDALNKLVVKLRGRIRNYRRSRHGGGLVEWDID